MSASDTRPSAGGFTGRLEAELVKVVTARAAVPHSRRTRAAVALRRPSVRAGLLAAGAAVTVAGGLASGVLPLGQRSAAPSQGSATAGAEPVHVRTAAFTVDTAADGTVRVTWDKSRYIEGSQDSPALQQALREAGFPVLIREGIFCAGPHDNAAVDPSGDGPGVGRVMRGQTQPDGSVVFTFMPSAMPRGEELFIGFLDQSQLAITHGRPGSVERLVPVAGPLTCTTRLPFPQSP